MTVGGLVTECKTIRTKSGNQMMFATLDDVEAQVEMLVFKADTAESAQVIKPDAVVTVRGRVDHKEPGETKLVVTEAEAFEPNAAEIARAGAASRAPQGPVASRSTQRTSHPRSSTTSSRSSSNTAGRPR